ncbi:uncharacterized protein RSE6_14675 [Rhynchosporium secalis]|uniref:Uncharacterized protein n=1 Tax=Rhynchosporium secalis TaxID=38038 RepID=A0A1E1MVY7_RHYSE|nr:uncharacterized protein RSE6_14675 [Rhynchosporium secalis]
MRLLFATAITALLLQSASACQCKTPFGDIAVFDTRLACDDCSGVFDSKTNQVC